MPINIKKLASQARILIDQNQKIEAIKLVRETMGWGLKESKDYVDALARAALPALNPADEVMLGQEIKALIQQDRYAEAVKQVREWTGWGLRDCKAHVDALIKKGTVNWIFVASRASDLLDQGVKDEAVEWVTTQAKLDAQQAEEYVNFVLTAKSTHSSPDNLKLPAPVVAQVRDLLTRDRKVEAVKLVRILTNWGLRDSKDCVDSVEQSETTVDYGVFSTDELLTALELAGRCPDLELIRACLERREELTPALLSMLTEGTDPTWDDDDPRHYCEIHAGLLLCAFREPAALPIFGQVFRDEARDNMPEWFHEGLSLSYGPSAVPMLLDLMSDMSIYQYPRTSAMGMLAIVARNHPEERERIVQALRAMLPLLGDDGDLPPGTEYEELWTWIAHSLMELRDTDSQPHVLALYRTDVIDEWIMGDEQEYLDLFQQPVKKPSSAYDVMDTYEWLHSQAKQEAQWKAEAAERAAQEARRKAEAAKRTEKRREREASQAVDYVSYPVTQTQPKIGRNAPCPCGSGRKYKHCCGKKR